MATYHATIETERGPRGENATATSGDRVTLSAVAGGTRFRHEADRRRKGVLRIAAPLLKVAFNRVGSAAAAVAA